MLCHKVHAISQKLSPIYRNSHPLILFTDCHVTVATSAFQVWLT